MPLDICMLQQIYFARMYTPSPLHDGAGGTLPEDDSVSKLSEDFSSTENRDVTEIDEEINLGRFRSRTGNASGAHVQSYINWSYTSKKYFQIP